MANLKLILKIKENYEINFKFVYLRVNQNLLL